jgi:flagellar biosynthetic protein FlhB
VDYLALRIREIGNASKVPIVFSPLLARVLYSTTDVNKQIPHHLFIAVAEVLAYVYRLREAGQRFVGEPIDMTDLDVPDIDYDA